MCDGNDDMTLLTCRIRDCPRIHKGNDGILLEARKQAYWDHMEVRTGGDESHCSREQPHGI